MTNPIKDTPSRGVVSRLAGKTHIIVPWAFMMAVVGYFVVGDGEHSNIFQDPDEWFAVDEPLMVRRNPETGVVEACASSEITRAFSARWRTTLRTITSEGPVYYDGAEADRSYDYKPRAHLEFCEPFEEYTNLALPTDEGLYRLSVTWPMETDDGQRATQRASSHVFRIPFPPLEPQEAE